MFARTATGKALLVLSNVRSGGATGVDIKFSATASLLYEETSDFFADRIAAADMDNDGMEC